MQTYGTSNCENTVKQSVAKPSLLQIQKPVARKFGMIRQITTTESKYAYA